MDILKLSRVLLGPPKTPRNVFFPWQTFCVHKSGSFLERNRLALRVPINMTKYEIREYMRRLYGARLLKVNTLIKQPERKRCFTDKRLNYYRNGPMMKKAILTLEHSISDEVKMISSCRNVARNPAVLKKNVSYGYKASMRTMPNRTQMYSMGVCRESWRLPLPNLLAGDDWNLNPDVAVDENETLRLPNPMLPHTHVGVSDEYHKPEAVPGQRANLVKIDLQPWRKMIGRLRDSGILTNPWSNPALLVHPGNRGSPHPTILRRPRPVGKLWENTHIARRKERMEQQDGETPWKPPT
eukprot:GHVS01106496.1.p1 GENE.GHVS01106496.1~~GHVS01106496.1.p1  ORF type:complete len:297 (-),score=-4.52 GHVS01106496.1:2-892(-)